MSINLNLDEVTLCCVDTRSPALALRAMKLCMAKIRFGKSVFLGPKWFDPSLYLAGCNQIEYICIDDLSNIHSYSEFMLRRLLPYVETSHALVVQWDGYITNPDLWRPEFLQYDYIGAPWHVRNQSDQVGNGGFSLRSKRLLEAVARLDADFDAPEDETICKTFRDTLESSFKLQFAPVDIAKHFACEYGAWRNAFGFHGVHNFGNLMPDKDLLALTRQFPGDILLSKHTRNLIKSLIKQGRTRPALTLIKDRIHQDGWSLDHCLLIARALLLGIYK